MVDLYGKRHYFFALSILIVLAGFVGYLVNGVQLDIQFQGGTVIQIEMDDAEFDTNTVEETLSEALNKDFTVQKLTTYNAKDAENMITLLRLSVSKEDTLTSEEMNKLMDILKENFNVQEDAERRVQSVEPFIGKEMLQKGILAAIIASALIVIYVWWRFSAMSGLAAAIFANLALFHDALVMLAFYLIFKLPLNESFIAAVLTILGFSINDTIVIYDRIRENLRLTKKAPIAELVNSSVIQTMSRTINTTLTVLICVITVYVFAVVNNIQSIKDFVLPLLVGLISGTYSTVFIASPLWAMWQQFKTRKKTVSKGSKAVAKAK